MNLSETRVMMDEAGAITDYVFLDPSATTHYPVPNRRAFDLAVSFSVASKLDRNYPVVFEDRTTSDGRRLHPIEFKDVPPAIKRKLTLWLRLQPGGGTAGPSKPAKPASSSTDRPKRADGRGTASDRLKEELVRHHPGTRAADWKRRSKTRTAEGTARSFEHADGRRVEMIERDDGTIVITGHAAS